MEIKENWRLKRARHLPKEWPTFAELDIAEQILLRAARRLSACCSETPLKVPDRARFREEIMASVGQGFGVSLGPNAGASAAGELNSILQTVCCAGFKPLDICRICEPTLTPDERFLLSFVAGCQADDPDHIRSLLSWLLPPAAVGIAAAHGQTLAHIFQAGGLVLPQRLHLAGCIGYSQIMPCHGELVCAIH